MKDSKYITCLNFSHQSYEVANEKELSIKQSLPEGLEYIFILKVFITEPKNGSWQTFIYDEFESLIRHLRTIKNTNHHLFLLDNRSEEIMRHLIHLISCKAINQNDGDLIFFNHEFDEVLKYKVKKQDFILFAPDYQLYRKEYPLSLRAMARRRLRPELNCF